MLLDYFLEYYLEPDNIHRLHEALCDLYCGFIERSVRAFRPNGFRTSDDLGHQKQLFVRPELFRAFMKPYYARIGAVCYSRNAILPACVKICVSRSTLLAGQKAGCVAAGHHIAGGTPFENIAAFLGQSARYGTEHCRRFAK